MTKKQLNIISYFVFVGLAIFLVVRSLKNVDLHYVWSVIKEMRLWLVVIVFPVLVLSHWFRAVRWKQLTDSFHPKTKSFNFFAAVITGYLLNLVFPRLGEVGKCSILAKYEKISPTKSVGTIVVERIVDVISLALLIVVTLVIEYKHFYSFFYDKVIVKMNPDSIWKTIAIAVLVIVVAIGIIVCILRIPHNPISLYVKKLLHGFKEGILSITKLKNIPKFISLSILIWLMYLLGTWISFYALSSTSVLSFEVAFPVLVMGSVGMIITPGGIGAYWVLIQQTLLVYSISPNDGFAYGCLIWVVQYGALILLAFFSWLILPFVNKKNG